MRRDVDGDLDCALEVLRIEIERIQDEYANSDAWDPQYCPAKEHHEFFAQILGNGRCIFCERDFNW